MKKKSFRQILTEGKIGKPKLFRYPSIEAKYLLSKNISITTDASTVPIIEITDGDYLCLPKEVINKKENKMEITDIIELSLLGMIRLSTMCIEAKDINEADAHQLYIYWERIKDDMDSTLSGKKLPTKPTSF